MPPDPVTRRVLDLLERTHPSGSRLEAPALLLAAARGLPGGGATTSRDGSHVHVSVEGRDVVVRAGPSGSLAERLGPALEALLAATPEERRPDARAALLDALLRSVDRWSKASTGRRRLDQQERREGVVGGIGARIGRREGIVRVLGVVPGGGAEAAGVRAGDALVSVAGRPCASVPVSEILALLRGAPGTSVAIELAPAPGLGSGHADAEPGVAPGLAPGHADARRSAGDATVEPITRRLQVERREMPKPSMGVSRREDGVLVVRISHFSRRSGAELAALLAAERDARDVRGIVLDLRGNSGGSMLGAASVADAFLSSGVIAEALDDRDRPVEGLKPRVEATPGGDVSTPLACLVDRRTASSAELLAAALAWNGRATIAGERTFGKNVVGKPHAFPEANLAVTITSATMRAAGRPLPAEGLEPDLAVDPRSESAVSEVAARLLSGRLAPRRGGA